MNWYDRSGQVRGVCGSRSSSSESLGHTKESSSLSMLISRRSKPVTTPWVGVQNAFELGMSLELVGLDTYNLDSDLCALQLRCRFRDLKENEKVTRQIKLHGLRRMNRLMFLGLLRTQQAWKGERSACGLSNNILAKSSFILSSQNAYRSTNRCYSSTWATKSFSSAIYIAWLRTIKLVVTAFFLLVLKCSSWSCTVSLTTVTIRFCPSKHKSGK